MNFSQRVVINTNEYPWIPSPSVGVWRKPLAREAAECGHATSLVRFEAGASFSPHDHPLGEEILVLEGTFSDESGDYAAGSYFRNPEGFIHAPFSKTGCVILVKLHQFRSGDNRHLCIETANCPWQPGSNNVQLLPLDEFEGERVVLERWPAGTQQGRHQHPGGEEIYVISGEFIDEQGRYPAGTWLRNPHASGHTPQVAQDTLLYVKRGHLPCL